MYHGKRLFDILFSSILLIILWPFFLVIAILIKIESGGPIFYKASRVGRLGKDFKMWKFRTMVKDAEMLGPVITVSNDERVTKIGKILRRTKIDELPSFFNVLIGDMSVVGPRPECVDWVKKYSDEEKKVLFFKPGVTGPAQIKFKSEEKMLSGENWQNTYLKIMKNKLIIDLQYFATNSFFRDLRIIIKTIV